MVWTYMKSSLTQKNQYQCLSYLPNGLKLLNIDPAALVNTSLAKLFALPNLSHFVNAIALVIDNEVATIINKRYKNCNFKTAKTPNTTQATGCPYNKSQNTLESIGLIYLLGSAVSNTQTFSKSLADSPTCPLAFPFPFPFSLSIKVVSFHHRNPTNNHPEIFFKFQKSPATSKIKTIKCNINVFLEVN